jgi:hypothetical protein
MQPSCGRPAITWTIDCHNRLMVGVSQQHEIHMIRLTVTPADAGARLDEIENDRFHSAVAGHWTLADEPCVPIPTVCWLFCWAKTGGNSQPTAEALRPVFTSLLDISYEEFDNCVPHQWARNSRYSTRDLESELRVYLQRRTAPESAPPTDVAVDTEPPPRIPVSTYRVLRDTAIARQVKQLHGYRCQISGCDHMLILPNGSPYAEAHHIKPLGGSHRGPDIESNIICVCPNHHAALDYGAITLDLSSLNTVPEHTIAPEFIRHHNTKVVPRNAG